MKNCGHRRCLAEISADEVIREMQAMLGQSSLTRGGYGISV
jgi:hypothetical protein